MDDRMKRKSQKLAKQSFALLQRIKSKKQKAVVINDQNYIEDLYFKIFSKCSPHFNKMQTSNQILNNYKSKISQLNLSRQEIQECLKCQQELKRQIIKLKQTSDDSIKIKLLNQQLNSIGNQCKELSKQIRTLKKENSDILQQLQRQKQANSSLKELNQQLEEFVSGVAKEMEEFSTKKNQQSILNQQLEQMKAQNQSLLKQLSSLQKEIQILKKDNHALKLIQQQCQSIIKKAKEQAQLSKQKIQQSQSTIKKLHDKVLKQQESFKQQKIYVSNALKQAENDRQSFKQRLLQAESFNSQKQKQANQKQYQLHEQQIALSKIAQQKALILQEHKVLKGQINKITLQSLELKEKILDLQSKYVDCTKQLQQNRMKADNLIEINKTQKDELQYKIDELKQRIKFFKESNQSLNNQKIDLINSVELLAQNNQELTKQLEQQKQKVNDLEERINTKQNLLKQAEKNNNLALMNIQKQNSKKSEQSTSSMQETIKKLKNQITQIENSSAQTKKDAQNLRKDQQQQVQSLNNQISSLEQQIKSKDIIINQLRQSITNQTTEQSTIQQYLIESRAKFQSLEQLRKQQKSNSQKCINELTSKINLVIEEKDNLFEQKSVIKQQNKRLIMQNSLLNAQITALKTCIEQGKEKQSHLDKKLEKYEENLRKITFQFEEIKKEKDDLLLKIKDQSITPLQGEKVVENKPSKTGKHIETINQLTNQLTDAYKMINQLQSTIQTMQTIRQQKIQKKNQSSPNKKQRPRSVKKLASIFGF